MTRTRACDGGEPGSEGCAGSDIDSETCNNEDCAEWSVWSAWSDCSVSCGGGEAIRSRNCQGGEEGQEGCLGESVDIRPCEEQLCAQWAEWAQWSGCSVTCGGGSDMRTRICNGGLEGDEGCIGDLLETKACNDQPCNTWNKWGPWSDCSATCGEGEKVRTRSCEGGLEGENGCFGSSIEVQSCSDEPCIAALWSAWTAWGGCSVTCGEGEEIRTRSCDGGVAGVAGCPGTALESRVCNDKVCPQWGEWSTWSDCSATCGGGEAIRTRSCEGGLAGEAGCFGLAIEAQACNENECPFWGEWSLWVACNASCGEGIITRTRECQLGEAGVDIGCLELPFESKICDAGPCSWWGEWESWSICGCGDEIRSRNRECLGGEPGKGGCDGLPAEIEECGALTDLDCPLWSPWSTWSECSTTCGGGLKERSRICINAGEGSGCPEGDTREELDCNPQACPSWTAWSDWSVCSKTCDGGVRERSRLCLEGMAGDMGCELDNGVGEYHEQACNEQLCPRFDNWTPWSACNATCGTQGVRTHTRKCIGGTVGQLGCEGPVSEDQECAGKDCAFYSPWNNWESCSKPCGGGVRSRARLCINGVVGEKGCEDPDVEEEQCNEKPCASWSTWGQWGACSRSCGTGEKFRIRMCINGEIDGSDCPTGESVSTVECATQPCVGCSPDVEFEGIEGGSVVCTKASSEGSECTFACDDNYQLIGLDKTSCVKDSNGELDWNQQPPTCSARCSDEADIIFVIDSSSSIKAPNFRIVRNFLKEIVKRFRVGPDAALFGALRYNFNVSKLWDIADYSTKGEVLTAIANIPYDGSGTQTGKAINYTREYMFTEAAGRRPGVPKIVLVITDGVSFDDVEVPSKLLKAENVLMVAVGIGNVNIGEINAIASDPDRNFATTVSNFDSLATVVNTIADQIKLCQPVEIPESCPPQALMDLVFIVDSSSSIGAENFEIMRTFIKDVVSKFNINFDSALFGLIIFNRDVTEVFQLGDFITAVDVLGAIDDIPYRGSGTMTGQAIRYAARNAFLARSGSRPGVPKVAIVITDGKSQDNVAVAAMELKARANVVAIGIEGAVKGELNAIASSPENVFTTKFSTLSDVLTSLGSAVCFASRSGIAIVP